MKRKTMMYGTAILAVNLALGGCGSSTQDSISSLEEVAVEVPADAVPADVIIDNLPQEVVQTITVKTKTVCYYLDGSIHRWEEYDTAGNLTKNIEYDYDGSILDGDEREYDTAGNETKYIEYDSDGNISYWHEREYDAEGELTKKKEIEYNYDGSIYLEFEYKYKYEYDIMGNMTKETQYNTDGSISHWWEYEYTTIIPQ